MRNTTKVVIEQSFFSAQSYLRTVTEQMVDKQRLPVQQSYGSQQEHGCRILSNKTLFSLQIIYLGKFYCFSLISIALLFSMGVQVLFLQI